ncbi:MAG: hypothetical protein AAFW68_12310 [Pseudomonadota bacterium]
MTFHEESGAACALHAHATPVRSGIYGWLTPYLAQIAEHNAGFAERILRLCRTELHFVALCITFMGERRDDADHLAAFASGIDRRTRKALFAEFAPEMDVRLVRFAGKLGGRPWRISSYQRLAVLFAEPHARKTLRHMPHITRWHLIALARLPAHYRKLGLIRKLKSRRELSCTLFAIHVVRRIRTDLNDRQIIASLEKADTRYVRQWVEAHYERLPFPQAPTGALTDGQGVVLRPVNTASDLIRTAREFDNCVDNYLWEAITARSYFYRFENNMRRIAVAELKPVPGAGWAINDILGPKNTPLSGVDRQKLLGLFYEQGILPAPQALSNFAWFDID